MLNPRKAAESSNGDPDCVEEIINLGNDREMRLDDKVICTENNWMVMVDAETFVPLKETVYDKDGNAKEDFQTDFVANGEIGKVVRIARVVINAKGDTKLHLYVSFEVPKRTVVVSGEQLFCFDLAGCVTCHKMQGSQAKYVIYVADDNAAARMIGSRQLVYTALSRFEKAVFVVGSEALIRQDCGVDALSSRKTLLTEKLCSSQRTVSMATE
jgi:ATP-dependent exoDNAse (exonuclease V) alpha subunit